MTNNTLATIRLANNQTAVKPTLSSNHAMRLTSSPDKIKDSNLIFQKDMHSKICIEKEVYGYFAILIFNVRFTPHIVFIYWDDKKSCVKNFMFHTGRGYYKEFFKFITSTMDSLKEKNNSSDNAKNIILLPKNSVSESILQKLNWEYNFSFASYQRRGSQSKITKIQKEISFRVPRGTLDKLGFTNFQKIARDVIDAYTCTESKWPSDTQAVNSYGDNSKNVVPLPPHWSKHLRHIPYIAKRTFASIASPQYAWREFGASGNLGDGDIEELVNNFWENSFKSELMSNPGIKVAIQLKGMNGGMTRSISFLDIVDFKDKEKISKLYVAHWDYKTRMYEEIGGFDSFLSFKFVSGDIATKFSSDRDICLGESENNQLRSNNTLPLNSNFKSWGICTPIPQKYGWFNVCPSNSNLSFEVNELVSQSKNTVKVLVNGMSVDVFSDHYVEGNKSLTLSESNLLIPEHIGEEGSYSESLLEQKGLNFSRHFHGTQRVEYYKGGKLETMTKSDTKMAFITPLKNTKSDGSFKNIPKNKIIGMDLETRINDKGDMEIVCASIVKANGKAKTFNIWDYTKSSQFDGSTDGPPSCSTDVAPATLSFPDPLSDDSDKTLPSSPVRVPIAEGATREMIQDVFKYLMVKENNKALIYLHNFSRFDSLFLLKTLFNMQDVKCSPVVKDGKMIQLKVAFKKRAIKTKSGLLYDCSLTFYDSLLIMPASLSKLAIAFNLPQQKGFFPLKVLNNKEYNYDYVGVLPPIDNFYHPDPELKSKEYGIFKKEYLEFEKQFNNGSWSLKKELVKYCELDAHLVNEVLLAFTVIMWDKFKINIQGYPTIPSISLALYRTNSLKEGDLICKMGGDIFKDIRRAYYGGFVDSYRPYAQNVNSYDVNSLYPSSMLKFPMPVGKPTKFEGNPENIEDLFGFVCVDVTAPLHLKTPILPHKVRGGNGTIINVIYPVGSWSDWYFTEEIKNAEQYGYTFRIKRGYSFQQEIMFDKYISDLYEIKKNASPGSPLYIIAKLLMNSLYGRFGMEPDLPESCILNDTDFDEFITTPGIDVMENLILDKMHLISFKKKSTSQKSHSLPNISIPIAAAIASYSRIQMTDYVISNSDNICAIDTDGIKITSVLPPNQIGNELGQMKFEGQFKEGVFIAPKVYGGVTADLDTLVRIKGLKNPCSYFKLKTLLFNKDIKSFQEIWLRDLPASTIHIIERSYTLAPTGQKRQLIRTSFGEFIGTRPFLMKDGKKLTLGPSVLYFLPDSSIKALPDSSIKALPLSSIKALPFSSIKALPFSTIRSLPAPLHNIIYLPSPLPNTIYLPSPLPNIIYLPDLETMPFPLSVLPIMPTIQEDGENQVTDYLATSHPICKIPLVDHFNYNPSHRTVEKQVTYDLVTWYPILTPQRVDQLNHNPYHRAGEKQLTYDLVTWYPICTLPLVDHFPPGGKENRVMDDVVVFKPLFQSSPPLFPLCAKAPCLVETWGKKGGKGEGELCSKKKISSRAISWWDNSFVGYRSLPVTQRRAKHKKRPIGGKRNPAEGRKAEISGGKTVTNGAPLSKPLIGDNCQILRFKSLAPLSERGNTWLHSIQKIRIFHHKMFEYYSSCYFTQLRKFGRLVLGSALFIYLNTLFYTFDEYNTNVGKSHSPSAKTWNGILNFIGFNRGFSDLLNTVDGDILESEIEYLFTENDEFESNPPHSPSSYLTSLTDSDLAIKTALAILLCVVVIGTIWWIASSSNPPTEPTPSTESGIPSTTNFNWPPTTDASQIKENILTNLTITHEERGFVRTVIRESLIEYPGHAIALRDHIENLSLDTILSTTPSQSVYNSTEEVIARVINADTSPTTTNEAVQATLRWTSYFKYGGKQPYFSSPPFSSEVSGAIDNSNLNMALTTYNSVTDLVPFNPNTIPIPSSVDISRYYSFISYLDHYNAIIAAYDLTFHI